MVLNPNYLEYGCSYCLNMNWIYNGKEIKDLSDFPPNSFGFVYLVTHKPTNKKYIGKTKNKTHINAATLVKKIKI